MKKRWSFLLLSAVLLFCAGGVAAALDQWTGTGEIVDMHCYKKDQAKKGEGHAGCAKKCLGGADGKMGLLQADGTVVELVAGEDKAAYTKLVDLAGKQAKVTGMNKDGVVTVATSGPAS
jgi:hypothetical protein